MIFKYIKNSPLIFVLPALLVGVLSAVLFASMGEKTGVGLDSDSEETRYWIDVIQDVGGVAAYQHFDEKYANKEINFTHDLAHSFGEALYKVEGIDGVSVCDSNHGFGCYHSFFGWALLDNGLDVITDLDEACIAVYGEKGLGCQHGIGHGVLAELGSENLRDSLEACSTLNWQGPVGGCTSGVFMEYNFSSMGTRHLRDYVPGETHFPCTDVPEKYRQACYFEQPAWWVQIVNQDYGAVGKFCAEVEDENQREMCYRGAGNVAVGSSAYDIDFVIESCHQMPDQTGISHCIQGAAWIISAQKELGDIWQPLCDSLVGEEKEICFNNISFI